MHRVEKGGGLDQIPLLPMFETGQQPSHRHGHAASRQIGVGGGEAVKVREFGQHRQHLLFDRRILEPGTGEVAGGGLRLLAGEFGFAVEVGHDHRFHAGPGAGGLLHLTVIAQGGEHAARLVIIGSLQRVAGIPIEVGDAGSGGRVAQESGAGGG